MRLRKIHRGTRRNVQPDRALRKSLLLFRDAAKICDFVRMPNRVIVSRTVELEVPPMSLALRLQVLAAFAAFAFVGAIVLGAL